MSSSDNTSVRPIAPLLLLALSLGECLLSLFQWMELLVVRAGGHTLCNISDVMNCEAVWSSSFASRIQRYTLLPVAGLGLLWGLTAFALCAALAYRLLAQKDPAAAIAGVRLAAAAGLLSCITFGVASARVGALCLTCLGTYVIVLGFALVAARGLPGALVPTGAPLRGGLGWAAGFAVASYLVLVGPGSQTPSVSGAPDPAILAKAVEDSRPNPGHPGQSELDQFLASLPPEAQQEVSQSLAVYKHSPTPPVGGFPTRFRVGSGDAPVKIVEFTDVRCPHCKHLEETLNELRKAVPDGTFSVEPRFFPLDGECNSSVAFTDGTHVRCTGAKALVCLEGRPEYWGVRERIYAEQEALTVPRVLELAMTGGMSKDELDRCIANPETQAKLKQDEAYALEYKLTGTPLVLVNGREGTAVPAFLYAMALTGGNADAPAFARLAPPQAPVGP